MKNVFLFIFMVILEGFLAKQVYPQNQFDKGKFYSVISGNNLPEIDRQIVELNSIRIPEKEAYIGALLAKKAGLMHKPKEKLSLFRDGRSRIEAAIGQHPENAEFRFLRLMIQEHSPRNVNYKKQISADSEYIRRNFKTLSTVMQKIVMDYSRNSSVLKPADF